MKKTSIILIFATAIIFSGCCKALILQESINKVKFEGYTLSEVDSIYVLPYNPLQPVNPKDYSANLETTQSLETKLKRSLTAFSSIQIILKDTSKKYIVQVTKQHTEQINNGNKSCRGSNTLIDSFTINNQVFWEKIIVLKK